MTRTALGARLQRLHTVVAAAAATGHGHDPVDLGDALELDARQRVFASSDQALTRRQVLARAVVAGAAASSVGQLVVRPRRAAALPRPASQPSIAIIGAGISGLSAAMRLRDAGFARVTVYESNTRIGGRTFTRSNDGFFEAGQWAEWGGELIDTPHKTVLALCRRYGFSVMDLGGHAVATNGAEDTLYVNGAYYPWAQAVQDWKAAGLEQIISAQMNTLPPYPWPYTAAWTPDALAISAMTVGQWIDRYVPGGRTSNLGRFIDVAYAIEFGADIDEQSVLNLLGLLGSSNGGGQGAWWVYGKSDERWKIVGGNQQIAKAQAAELGSANIAFGHALSAARRLPNGQVRLTFSTGAGSTAVTADRVVLAVPLGVMKALAANGAFAGSGFDTDVRKMGSIAALGFGADNKLQLQIADRFWTRGGVWGNGNGESYADTGYQEAWPATVGQPGTTGILNNYTGGSVSRLLNPTAPFSDTAGPGAVGQYVSSAAHRFLAQIEPVYPGMTTRWTGKAMLAVWHKNPHSLGSYAYLPPRYCERFCTYERVAVRPFHFAGEHVSQEAQGYIEGGAAEGIRAAGEIVSDYV